MYPAAQVGCGGDNGAQHKNKNHPKQCLWGEACPCSAPLGRLQAWRATGGRTKLPTQAAANGAEPTGCSKQQALTRGAEPTGCGKRQACT